MICILISSPELALIYLICCRFCKMLQHFLRHKRILPTDFRVTEGQKISARRAFQMGFKRLKSMSFRDGGLCHLDSYQGPLKWVPLPHAMMGERSACYASQLFPFFFLNTQLASLLNTTSNFALYIEGVNIFHSLIVQKKKLCMRFGIDWNSTESLDEIVEFELSVCIG